MLELLESAITSPWAYLVLFAIALLDAFLPIVPSETLVITAGVFAASTGEPHLLAVIALASLGAFVGDHISYQIGQRAGAGILRRLRPGGRQRRAFDWAAHALAVRGGLLLVVARYIPGGRTATTVTAGAVGYPRNRFAIFDSFAACTWGTYAALIGYLGGTAFGDDTLNGLLFGLGLAAGIAVLVEVCRYLHRRPTAARTTPAAELVDDAQTVARSPARWPGEHDLP